MEIKTCEEYVLNELDRTQKELEEVKKENITLKTSVSLQEDEKFDYISCIKLLYHQIKNPIEITYTSDIPYFALGNTFITLKVSWLRQNDVEKLKKCVKIMELVDEDGKKDVIKELEDVIEEYENQKELKQEDK